MRASINRQRGFSFWEVALYLLAGGFVFTCVMKLGPHYVDDSNVAAAIHGVHQGVAGKDIYEVTNSDIKNSLAKYFEVSMISDDILKLAEIERTNSKVLLKLKYDAKEHFMGNIDVVMHFEHVEDLASPVKE